MALYLESCLAKNNFIASGALPDLAGPVSKLVVQCLQSDPLRVPLVDPLKGLSEPGDLKTDSHVSRRIIIIRMSFFLVGGCVCTVHFRIVDD